MTTISEMARRWQGLNLHKEVQITIGQTSKDIIKANQDQLFNEGKDSEGKKLRPYHWEAYRQYKLAKNPADVTDLKDTGDFYKGFFVDVQADSFLLDSKDSKEGKLTSQYGPDIFGLTPESRENYTFSSFWKTLKDKLETILKLQFV